MNRTCKTSRTPLETKPKIVGIEGEKKESESAENSPNLEKQMVSHVSEAFRTLNRQNQKRTFPCHSIAKTSGIQNKERIMKALRYVPCHLQRQSHQNNNGFLTRNFKSKEDME
jgi:hypothetical protein